jgi:type II secretory pathway pseudopilin PulG
MAVKHKKTGLTLVEILVVLGIIALLAGVLLPAMTVVKNTAKEAKQKAQFSAINLALVTFKNDYGDYPPSDCPVIGTGCDYNGAQKLAEALLGWDLLGFHPKTAWRADGFDIDGGDTTYDPEQVRDLNGDGVLDTLKERKNRYIDIEAANAFKLGETSGADTGLFEDSLLLEPDTYVLCDVFNMKKVILPSNGKSVSAGSPVLYYKANNSMDLITDIYDVRDNNTLLLVKEQADSIEQPLGKPDSNYEYFYDYIRDPKIESIKKPYKPDSFILISAGLDGIYGTSDDIRNFGN